MTAAPLLIFRSSSLSDETIIGGLVFIFPDSNSVTLDTKQRTLTHKKNPDVHCHELRLLVEMCCNKCNCRRLKYGQKVKGFKTGNKICKMKPT